jgi:hypothetical protein
MKQDDLITLIQDGIVRSQVTNTVRGVIKAGILNGILKHILEGEDRLQIVRWLNRERLRAGKRKRELIDECWELVGDKIDAND